MFRELVEIAPGSQISHNRGLKVPANSIFPTPSQNARYCSLFMFGSDIEAHVKLNKSFAGFKGKTYLDAVWIDIDAPDNLEGARLACLELVKRLNTEYQINPDHLFIYFSGNKGFHLAIHPSIVGFSSNDHTPPEKVKDFVIRITKEIPFIDTKIYEPIRIFRIENSRHEKTGLYKLRINYTELQCEADAIKQLASKPRVFPYKVDYSLMVKSTVLSNLWHDSGAFTSEQAATVEYKGNLFEPPAQGNRNNQLLVQACTLFRKSELSKYSIQDIVSNAAFISSLNTADKISEEEVKRIVANAEKLVGDERKKAKAEELNIKSFGEWVPEWESYALQQQTPMTLCFPELNRLMRGRLKGKLGVIMGYGGSKKSLFALNTCLRNIRENQEIAIYSTMEMSAPQLINRIIDHEVKPAANIYNQANASKVLEEIYKQDVSEGRKFLNELAKALGNNLQIVSNSRMTYEYYKLAIQKVKETTGAPSILIVDGLSMMGGKGSETEVYSQNSADLKELANEENMMVLLICHASKGAEKDTRDLSRNIRGSEKILDNCDFYMTMSQIRDDLNMEQFNPLKGFINFHDKRGSGQYVDQVFDFDAQRLHLKESTEDPKQYYESKRKSKFIDSDF